VAQNSPRSKPYSQFPRGSGITDNGQLSALDWVVTQLNQLIGQGQVPPSQSLATFGPNIINPTTAQIISAGSRVSAIATAITYVATTTGISFYWDGTNGSQPFQLFRDDTSIVGPTIVGSPHVVTGLSASTLYYFYPYWSESLQLIQFGTVAGVSVGNPAIAFTAKNNLAAQQQILRGNVPLAALLSSAGVTTPGTGSTSASGGSGGSGSGIGGNGRVIS
jgi:hypothetical protein